MLAKLEQVRTEFNGSAAGGTKISLADLIVLGGTAAVEDAARKAGQDLTVPFSPGRTDARDDQTDVESFAVLEPVADAFRNYAADGLVQEAPEHMIDKAQLLTLTAPQMTVLIGGLRVLGNNVGGSKAGVFTDRPGVLTNDFFVNLLDMNVRWQKSDQQGGLYQGVDRKTGEAKWTASNVDLVFGSHSELRAIAETYGASDSLPHFVKRFVQAWVKVMNADRYDL